MRVDWCLQQGGYPRAFLAIWVGGRWCNFDTYWASGARYVCIDFD